MIRTIGVDTQGGQAGAWRQLGDVGGEFTMSFEGVDIRSSEDTRRPVLATIPQVAFLMTFTPGADRIGPPPHPIFGMFEDLPNPLVSVQSNGDGTGVILKLRDGQGIWLTRAETAAIAVQGGSLIDPGGLLHGKVMALQPVPGEGSIRITSFAAVSGGNIYPLDHGAKVATVTAQGSDLIEGEDFSVDPLGSLIEFHRDFRDIEILWESPRIPRATRTVHDAYLDHVSARSFDTVDETESRPWGDLITSDDVVRLRGYSAVGRLGGTP